MAAVRGERSPDGIRLGGRLVLIEAHGATIRDASRGPVDLRRLDIDRRLSVRVVEEQNLGHAYACSRRPTTTPASRMMPKITTPKPMPIISN